MSTFSDRLKECRKNMNKTQKDVATYLGITERGYQNYEIGKREPNIETLNRLAGYLKTSVDYLVGFDPSDGI